MNSHTMWHKMVERLDADRIDPSHPQSDSIKEIMRSDEMLAIVTDPSIPVIRMPDVVDGFEEREAKRIFDEFVTLSDHLGDALALPFDNFVVEHRSNESNGNDGDIGFIHFRHHKKGLLSATSFFMVDDFAVCHSVNRPVVMRQKNLGHASDVDFGRHLEGPDFNYPSGGSFANVLTLIITLQVCRMLLLLNTRGIQQSTIEPPKFTNRQRAKKGKPLIPRVVHIYASCYYDRNGEQHSYDERKPVAIHWRRGHVRHVWCGTGDERRREPRYISPCLVNYDGGEKPEHKVRVLH